MSDNFKNDLKELHNQGKLSDFEYNQLVCLNYLTGGLVNIEKRLIEVSDVLRKIEYKLETIASK
jgi:hypothetical protein